MPTELAMLFWTGMLCLALAVPYVMGSVPQVGLARLAGNREAMPALEGWLGRARRAHMNHVENLAPFAVLVLVAHAIGALDATTAVASQAYLGSRLAHAGFYIAGVPWLRTVAFVVGLVAEFAIAGRILAVGTA